MINYNGWIQCACYQVGDLRGVSPPANKSVLLMVEKGLLSMLPSSCTSYCHIHRDSVPFYCRLLPVGQNFFYF